ncbi:MAG TPA: amidohydrolase family protein, partial [Clostridia bacterium]|nr:amidohydrolase family protein [Clostridia bacterium]
DLCRLVAIASTNAAKIFGLYPKKGIIALGSDADMLILDTDKEKTLTVEDSLIGCDWHPYVGMKLKGWPKTVISKGKVIVDDGKFIGKKGEGKFIKRKISEDVLRKPVV